MKDDIKLQIEDKQLRVDYLQSNISNMQRERSKLSIEIKDLKEKLRNKSKCVKNLEITVTDHAVLRFLERFADVNIEDVRKKILSNENKELISSLGDGKYPINGFTARVKDRTIVTIF